MQGNAYRALLALEALVSDVQAELASARIARFLNCELGFLTGVLEDLKTVNPTAELAVFADRIRQAFGEIQRHCSTCCQRLGLPLRMAFRRMGGILFCLFRRGDRKWTEGALLAEREADFCFRSALLDRLADALHTLFAWLRDLCRRMEKGEMPLGTVPLGPSSARFVVTANTADGVFVMKFQDGHQELFNLTPLQWKMILPLLMTRHPLGHARLPGRPQSCLTRHDANGDELEGDLKRLKSYIHPVGRGRGGNGFYYLAPYPRRLNVV